MKFRAWYKPYNRMIDWEKLKAILDGSCCRLFKDPYTITNFNEVDGNIFDNPDFIIMRKVILPSFNDKGDFYQDDICEIKGSRRYLKLPECDISTHDYDLSDKDVKNLQVIGNIHENPELLKLLGDS